MAGDDPTTVEFGGQTYHLEPQRTGRIFRKLDRIRKAFGSANDSGAITANFREALEVFVPDLAPMWELVGYPSAKAYDQKLAHDKAMAEARDAYAVEQGAEKWEELTAEQAQGYEEPEWEEDPYDEEADHSPTGPEIADLIQAIYAVNGGKRLEKLVGNVVDPQMLRAITRNLYVQWATRQAAAAAASESPPEPSPSSSSPNGESASTSSGTTELTDQDAPATDSLLDDSSTDSTPEAVADPAN